MSKFPVDIKDSEGQTDAINYLLSGPGGLGQNFAGYSNSDNAYVTGNFRKPYTQITEADLYVAPIELSEAEMLDERTFKYTFASAEASPPFSVGNGLSVYGFSDTIYNTYPSSAVRNSDLVQIGVVECTTTYVIIRSVVSIPIHPSESVGPATAYIFYYSTAIEATGDPVNDANFIATDGDVRVTVTGATDRIFISGQLDLSLTYEATASTEFAVVVEVDRYVGYINNDPTNPDYLFSFDKTLAYKIYTFNVSSGTGTLDLIETVFATLLDQPPIGYYRYILNIGLGSDATNIFDAQFITAEVGLRGLSAQVVKE